MGHHHGQNDSEEESDVDSLFDSIETPAQRTCPPIPGLFFTPSLTIPTSLADTLISHCQRYFQQSAGCVNQVMLFGRHTAQGSGLPAFLDELIPALSLLLGRALPADVHRLLFPLADHVHLSRQAILNHYEPGEGITPHVDLLKRFGDGILGISLGSGTVMTFERVVVGDAETARSRHDVYLPERSIIVLTGEARYHWMHGIEERRGDYVEIPGESAGYAWIERKQRISITLRWLLPGADIVGCE